MSRCVIFTAGEQHGIEKRDLALRQDDFILCCDAGLRLAQQLNIRPHLIIGDFDSYTGSLPEGVPVQRLKRDKDDTDSMMATKYALAQGYDSLLYVAATGGRLDHLLGNLQMLAYVAQNAPGTAAEILGATERVWLLDDGGEMEIHAPRDSTFSVLCHSDSAQGVHISGARFPLDGVELTNRFPLGVSNRIAGHCAKISVERGVLFVILPREV